MILLTSTSDLLRINPEWSITNVSVHVSWVDMNGTTITPGRLNTLAAGAATTTIAGSPASGTQRNIKTITVANTNALISTPVTISHFDGTNSIQLIRFLLRPGDSMSMREDGSWERRDTNGMGYEAYGLGNYDGASVPFLKASTGSDVAGAWYCTSKDAGFPGAWSPGTPGVNGRVTYGTTTADVGCIPIPDSEYGQNFLSSIALASSVAHANMFFDVLWVNSGLSVTTTTAQSITTPTLPFRDANGASSGVGCMIGLLVTTVLTNAAANASITVSYTDSTGASGKTATLSAIAGSQLPATAVVGTIIWFNLGANTAGVRSIQSITLGTTLLTGAISLMICRPIATIGTPVVNVANNMGFGSPGVRLFDGTCLLHCIMSSATTATAFAGSLTVMDK